MDEAKKQLPQNLYRFFWDVDPAKMDVGKHRKYVIARLLEYGDTVAVRWVLKSFSKEELVEVLKQSRVISPKTANFWAMMYDIPREEIRCLEPSYLQLHKQVWPN